MPSSLLLPAITDMEQLIFSIKSDEDFNQLAIDIFRYQYTNNEVYRDFVDLMGINPGDVQDVRNIPFLPISFFKTHEVKSFSEKEEAAFRSSGTSGASTSKHFVKSLDLYRKGAFEAFTCEFGAPADYAIMALLPGYLERADSSLVWMVKEFMDLGDPEHTGFYLNDFKQLSEQLVLNEAAGRKTLLIGVTHALLQFASEFPIELNNTIIMETGGMKGTGKELTRTEIHQTLKESFRVESVASEYGMTELLSQCYATQDGKFTTPPWVKMDVRQTTDPLSTESIGKAGRLNIIDLANLYSCSFIATDDLAKMNSNGTFELLGRIDHSDIRGCNLLAL